MATHYKTQGLVFRKSDLNESDQLFSVFSKDFGRLEIFGKAIRKSASKLRSGMDVFYLSEIEFIQGKNKKTLTDATAIEKFRDLSRNPEKSRIASEIAEVLDNFIKGQEPDLKIFELVKESFEKLNNSAIKNLFQIIFYFFLWNFLALLGYKPGVDKCVICHIKLSPNNLYFSNKLGGVICDKCSNHDKSVPRVNSDVVKVLRLILKNDWQTLSKLKVSPSSRELFKQTSDSYYSFLSSR